MLLNGNPSDEFKLKRGLRQGNPLSPYLFIICVEVLLGLIARAQERKALHCIKNVRSGPQISHLLFVDNSIFFTRAT